MSHKYTIISDPSEKGVIDKFRNLIKQETGRDTKSFIDDYGEIFIQAFATSLESADPLNNTNSWCIGIHIKEKDGLFTIDPNTHKLLITKACDQWDYNLKSELPF